jgi:hypothetical protein
VLELVTASAVYTIYVHIGQANNDVSKAKLSLLEKTGEKETYVQKVAATPRWLLALVSRSWFLFWKYVRRGRFVFQKKATTKIKDTLSIQLIY